MEPKRKSVIYSFYDFHILFLNFEVMRNLFLPIACARVCVHVCISSAWQSLYRQIVLLSNPGKIKCFLIKNNIHSNTPCFQQSMLLVFIHTRGQMLSLVLVWGGGYEGIFPLALFFAL